MRILFVTSTRIGDAVLSTALPGHLLREHPEARFTVACGPAAEGVFARMPGLERLIVVAKRPLSAHWLDLWRQVAFTRWDLVVDLRASALAWTVPAARRAVGRGGRRPATAWPTSRRCSACRPRPCRSPGPPSPTAPAPPRCCRAAPGWCSARPPTGPRRSGPPSASSPPPAP
jgi:ADP-heptose:LPS heptosyltransferase